MNIAIIGGGASGVLAAIHILRQASAAQITLYEPNDSLGRGVAYGALAPWHVLNTPAGRVSAIADCPNHFSNWLVERGWDSVTAPTAFAPRSLYGEYLECVLHEAIQSAGPRVWFVHQRTPIVQIEKSGSTLCIESAEGDLFRADVLVLALGVWSDSDALPDLKEIDSERILPPLKPIDAAIEGRRILILGTGLTAVDALLGLHERAQNFHATAVSRHGLWPREHPTLPSRRFVPFVAPASPVAVLGQVREQIRAAKEAGSDWRAVLDGLREMTSDLWRCWSLREKQQFLRHLRTFWDTHRHRLAPKVSSRLKSIEENGKLRTVAGIISNIRQEAHELRADILSRRTGKTETIAADFIVPCLGNHTSLQSRRLLRQMQFSGLLAPDDAGLGIQALPDGRVVDADGTPHARLFAVGPLLRGVLWESTAIPEIREQAADLAIRLFRRSQKRKEAGAIQPASL